LLIDTQNIVRCCQNYTPTDCFFGDFAHWKEIAETIQSFISL